MKPLLSLIFIASILIVAPPAAGQQQSEYLSLRLEMERAIRKGNAFLESQQEKDGLCNHPWGHTKIQRVEPADPSNARSEFRGRRAILRGALLNN